MNETDPCTRILFENADFLVVDKPAGLLVHPVAQDSIALTQFFPSLYLCHRLDRETSGCLLLGKTTAAAAQAGRWFKVRKIGKSYLAVVAPAPAAESGLIDIALKKIAARMRPATDGQSARTNWRVLERTDNLALLELVPETGRLHQLRAHCAASGWPIVGDAFYGDAAAARLMLHAWKLTLPELGTITAPVPDEFVLRPGA